MAKINSRTKGSKNERQISKLFEDWTSKKFSRTPSSGGLNWKNSQVSGDIVCTTEGHYFPFSIEAKSHRDINFQHLLYLDNSKIMEFWEQCKGDSIKGNPKVPLLFMRYNGMPKNLHFVVMQTEVWMVIRGTGNNVSQITCRIKDENLVIVKSFDLLALSYRDCRKRLKNSPLWPRRKIKQ